MSDIKITEKAITKVLIIEDEGDTSFLLSTILKNDRFRIEQVNTMAQAATFLEAEGPDLVFLDNHLPDGLGVNHIEFIKDRYPESKIVMITAHGSSSDRKKAMNKGADIFLAKPFTREQIGNAVAELVGSVGKKN